ncbi:MAG: 30S ribosomal protein S1 [Lachnospiraceae bacterium]|nr:30S ribosomal protein S1 [Lachnospiraceae bacterium]
MSEVSFEQMLNEEGSLNQIRTGEIVTGTVIGVKDNEINLNIGYKADGVITKSEYTMDPSLDLKSAVKVGDQLRVKVLKVNDGEGQVLLSYRRLASDRAYEVLQESCENGTVLSGTVSQVTEGGLSVMVDGVRVFIPASMVSPRFERDLSHYMGQEVEFVITECVPRKRRVIGNRKKVIQERREAAESELLSRIEVGMILTGKVSSIMDYGAFIDLGGADGLLHISEMSWGRFEKPKKLLSVGQEVEVFVKSINGKKISLSMKFPDQNPWLHADEKYAIGNIVTGTVARMTDFGAFVQLAPGVDALLHVSQISSERVEKPSDVLKIGQQIEAKVLEYNPDDRKISISIKALEMDREQPAEGAPITIPEEVVEAVSEAKPEEAVQTLGDALPSLEEVLPEEAPEEKTEA